MPTRHAPGADYFFGIDVSGTLTQIASWRSFSRSGTAEMLDTSSADTYDIATYIAGERDATFSVSGLELVDDTTGDLDDAQIFQEGSAVTLVYARPGGDAVQVPCLVASSDFTADFDQPVEYSVELQRSGPVTKGTFDDGTKTFTAD